MAVVTQGRLPTSAPGSRSGRRAPLHLLCAGIIVVAGIIAYHNSFSVPFLFDDESSIANNPTIRSLGSAWFPPAGGETVASRPLLNFSLAVNFALNRLDVRGYHIFNLAAHLCAALVLFGLVRRTLLASPLRGRFAEGALPIAFSAALIWMAHPLQTESVTYVVQRAESLMGLFYLVTLYASARAMDSTRPAKWQVAAVAACAAGMATKEVMVSAPVLVLFYDRTFVSGGFRAAWQRRRWFYVTLAVTWIPLTLFVLGNRTRGGTMGLGVAPAPWLYWLTQAQAIVTYLKLSLWPQPLVFDYGAFWLRPWEAMPYLLIVVPAAAGALLSLWRWPAIGYPGLWFFGILAATSLVPGFQMIVEHRMYLPLAAIVVLACIALHAWLRRAFLPVALVLAALACRGTVVRNNDYRSAISIWQDTVGKRPEGARAQICLGVALMQDRARQDEAIGHLREAIRLAPDFYAGYTNLGAALALLHKSPDESVAVCEKAVSMSGRSASALNNLGFVLAQIPERREAAIGIYEEALRKAPQFAGAHQNLAALLMVMPGREQQAIVHLEAAMQLDQESAEGHVNLAEVYSRDSATRSEAVLHLQRAEELQPRDPKVWNNMGVAWSRIPGRQQDAIAAFESAIRLEPGAWDAHLNLATLLQSTPGREEDAIRHFEAVIRLDPDNLEVHTTLGLLLVDRPGRFADAVSHFEVVAVRNPDSHDAHYNLGTALMRVPERRADAIEQFQTALRLDPNDAGSHNNLGLLLAAVPGRSAEAITHFEAALRLKPNLREAHFNLAEALASTPGRRQDAIRQLEQALAESPDYRDARDLLARLTGQTTAGGR